MNCGHVPCELLRARHFDGLVCSRLARNFRSPEGRLCRPDNFDVHQVASGGGREGGLPPSR